MLLREWLHSGMTVAALATLIAISGAALGVWLTGLRERARIMVPFSAGVLLGVALFGLIPELAGEGGWPASVGLAAAGYLLLLVIDRFAWKICPTCSHDHDHDGCSRELHGFALPLALAAALHSLMDGWSVTAAQAAPASLRVIVPLAVSFHKLPEGMALGGIMVAAIRVRPLAFAWCIAAECATLIGGELAVVLAPKWGTEWTIYPLGIAAGWLCYLGYHAVHEEYRRSGARPAFLTALTGMAGAAVIQRGAAVLFR
jgi:zinc transporter ZupT